MLCFKNFTFITSLSHNTFILGKLCLRDEETRVQTSDSVFNHLNIISIRANMVQFTNVSLAPKTVPGTQQMFDQ